MPRRPRPLRLAGSHPSRFDLDLASAWPEDHNLVTVQKRRFMVFSSRARGRVGAAGRCRGPRPRARRRTRGRGPEAGGEQGRRPAPAAGSLAVRHEGRRTVQASLTVASEYVEEYVNPDDVLTGCQAARARDWRERILQILDDPGIGNESDGHWAIQNLGAIDPGDAASANPAASAIVAGLLGARPSLAGLFESLSSATPVLAASWRTRSSPVPFGGSQRRPLPGSGSLPRPPC